MSKRKQDSSAESLAEALSRVMVTRDEQDQHRENYDWATLEGRGDRMPRFLERAIQDVPHAARQIPRQGAGPARYQGRSRLRRVSFIMSLLGIGTGVTVSVVDPDRITPLVDRAHLVARVAAANFSFTSEAVAATPRLRFGEALRNYSEAAAAQAARANIVVSNLTPGATLSAGEQVSDTEWSLPQSDLENLVITFPRATPEDAMHATVEIPGNTKASSGKFSVELRRAEDGHEAAAVAPQVEGASEPVATEPPAAEAAAEPVEDKAEAAEKPVRKASKVRSETKSAKRIKPRPSAALPAKAQPQSLGSSGQKVAAAPKPATVASAQPTARAATADSSSGGESGPSLFGLFSSLAGNGVNPNALTLNSLGANIAD